MDKLNSFQYNTIKFYSNDPSNMHYCIPSIRYKHIQELIKAIAAAPAGVTSLYLNNKRLGDRSGLELTQAFQVIPSSVTSLSLGWNVLYQKSGAELEQAFQVIPSSVTSLDLRCNVLYKKSGAELEQAFKAIPGSVTRLDLGGNELGVKSTEELVQCFKAIPNNVTTLGLYMTFLGNKSSAELVQIFQTTALNNVTMLDLRANNLGKKTATELTEIFRAIPAGVTTFYFHGNGFNQEQVEALFAVLRTRRDVHIDFGEVEISQELKEEIHETNMNRSLLGHLLNNSFFIQPKPDPESTPDHASTSSALSSSPLPLT